MHDEVKKARAVAYRETGILPVTKWIPQRE